MYVVEEVVLAAMQTLTSIARVSPIESREQVCYSSLMLSCPLFK